MNLLVAPLAGAWIETFGLSDRPALVLSRPSRARGLKLNGNPRNKSAGMSRPSRARGLKPAASSIKLT